MKSFFEMSFEEYVADMRLAPDGLAREAWRRSAKMRFDIIKASDHYHDGIPCREYHNPSIGQELLS